MYDIATDSLRPATQEDWDRLSKFAQDVGRARTRAREIASHSPDGEDFNFKLACYVNPMRLDGLFVAEDKEIEPFKDIKGLDGSLRYPTTPMTRWLIPGQLEPMFAEEIVRRWNKGADK